jgi:hypothetical protein
MNSLVIARSRVTKQSAEKKSSTPCGLAITREDIMKCICFNQDTGLKKKGGVNAKMAFPV